MNIKKTDTQALRCISPFYLYFFNVYKSVFPVPNYYKAEFLIHFCYLLITICCS